MTEDQEEMLRAVLRNQEAIMNALAEILTDNSDERLGDLRRGHTITDLGTCVGFTHYFLADLTSHSSSESQKRSKN